MSAIASAVSPPSELENPDALEVLSFLAEGHFTVNLAVEYEASIQSAASYRISVCLVVSL